MFEYTLRANFHLHGQTIQSETIAIVTRKISLCNDTIALSLPNYELNSSKVTSIDLTIKT